MDMSVYGLSGITGGMGLVAGGAGFVGADGLAGGIKHKRDAFTDVANKHFFEKPLHETKLAPLAGISDRIMGVNYGVTKRLNKLFGGVFERRARMHQANAVSHINTVNKHAQTALQHLPQELGHALNSMLEAVQHGDARAVESYAKEIEELSSRNVLSAEASSALHGTMKSIDKHMKSLDKADLWNAMATGEHNTHAKVSNASLQRGLAQGLFAVGTTAETVSMVRSTYSDLETFRSLIADIKGVEKEEVNSGDVLFGHLPHIGNVARRALFTVAAPRTLLEAISQTMNVKMIMGGHVSLPAMFLPSIVSSGIGAYTQGNILDTYKEMKTNEQQGIANSAEQYASFIGVAHKGLHVREGMESSFTKELGRIYAERRATVQQVLAEVQNGKMDQLIYHIQHENREMAKPISEAEEVVRDNGGAPETPMPSAMVGQVEAIHPNVNTQRAVPDKPTSHAAMAAQPQPTEFASRITQPEPVVHTER